ncbi:hypothetical protein [Tenacibaculum sp. M341]|uniref:hypothetical protein n=1 Tax=Tenacibaculum sp. M341 TaxID=2530339 RepID=UPI00104886B5|nr:hypothetical protein [Tenacibaculum sp. M341]TCI93796.1 hypothetical protein EYW44_05105 [Tenacibaculum sp. M341]
MNETTKYHYQYLIDSVKYLESINHNKMNGCSQKEIDSIKQTFNGNIPSSIEEFLFLGGKTMGFDRFNSCIEKIKVNDGIEMVRANQQILINDLENGFKLDNDDYRFINIDIENFIAIDYGFIHGNNFFLLIKKNSGNDPLTLQIDYDNDLSNIEEPFSKLFDKIIKSWIRNTRSIV